MSRSHILPPWPRDEFPPRSPPKEDLPRVRQLYAEALAIEERISLLQPEQQCALQARYEDLAGRFFVPAMFRLALVHLSLGDNMKAAYWVIQAAEFGHPLALRGWHNPRAHFSSFTDAGPEAHAWHRHEDSKLAAALAAVSADPFCSVAEERYLLARLPELYGTQPHLAYAYAWLVEHGALDPPADETAQSIYESAAGAKCPRACIALARLELARPKPDLVRASELLFSVFAYESRAFKSQDHNPWHLVDAFYWLGTLRRFAGREKEAIGLLRTAARFGSRDARYALAHHYGGERYERAARLSEVSAAEVNLWRAFAALAGHPLLVSSQLLSGIVVERDFARDGVFLGTREHYEKLERQVGTKLYQRCLADYESCKRIEATRDTSIQKHYGRVITADVWRFVARAPASQERLQMGYAAEQAGNVLEAVRLYREAALCDAHPHAMYLLAALLRPSDAAAEEQWDDRVHWLSVAAVYYGHPYALRELVETFAEGRGVPRSPVEAGYYKALLAEYGRFSVERDLETARLVAEAAPPTAEGLLLVAWLRNAAGYDSSAALSGAAERGSYAARLCLTMRALIHTDKCQPAKDALHAAFAAPHPKKPSYVRGFGPPPLPPRSGSTLPRRPQCWVTSQTIEGPANERHLRSVIDLLARGYEPAMACMQTLKLGNVHLDAHFQEVLGEGGALSAMVERSARVGAHLCRVHGALAAADLLRCAAHRHPTAYEALARLCLSDCYLTVADALPFRLRAARFNHRPSLKALMQTYAKAEQTLHFYWRARVQPNAEDWHLHPDLAKIADGVAHAFSKYGGREYLPNLYAAVTGGGRLAALPVAALPTAATAPLSKLPVVYARETDAPVNAPVNAAPAGTDGGVVAAAPPQSPHASPVVGRHHDNAFELTKARWSGERVRAPPSGLEHSSATSKPAQSLVAGTEVARPASPQPQRIAKTDSSGSSNSLNPNPNPNPNPPSPRPSGPNAPFSVATFLEYADITGADMAAFVANAQRERIDTEEVLLRLSSEELASLGLSRLGDRKRFISAAQKWQEGRLGSRLNDGTIIPSDEVTVIEPPLGQGNFAAVYHGTFNAAPVALKVLFNVKGDEEEFWKEARTLHDLNARSHPNVLRFFGLCKLERPVVGWAFVTEYMSNGSLKDFLVKNGAALKLHQLYAFARKAAAGMLHLSNQIPPILHRDLGARNLLVGELDEREGTYTLRVADFGLARLSDSSGEYIVHGASPARWTAPEVWKDRKHTVAADVYSFGVTMWEIFTRGARPFDEFDDRTVVRKVREGFKLPRTAGSHTLPAELYELMVECCATEPTARPPWLSIHKRLEALEAAARRQPTADALPTVSVSTLPAASAASNSGGGDSSFGFQPYATLPASPAHPHSPGPLSPRPADAVSSPTVGRVPTLVASSVPATSYIVAGKGGAVTLVVKTESYSAPTGHTAQQPKAELPVVLVNSQSHSAGDEAPAKPPAPASFLKSYVFELDGKNRRWHGLAKCSHPLTQRDLAFRCDRPGCMQKDNKRGWFCSTCFTVACVSCAAALSPGPRHLNTPPDHIGKMIDEEVADPSLRRFWREMVESCSSTMYNGAPYCLTATPPHRVCSACKRTVQAAADPWLWVLVDEVGTSMDGCVCRDCMWPQLVKDCGVSVHTFIATVEVTQVALEETERWFRYSLFSMFALCVEEAASTITLARLARAVAWFGPMDGLPFFVRLTWLFTRPWFHGDISSAQAIALVEGNAPGAWLLRFSSTELGGFAFTVLTRDNRVTHFRVTRGANFEFVMRVHGVDETFASMPALLDGACKLLRLRQPIASSRLSQNTHVNLKMARATFLTLYDNLWVPPAP